MVKEVADVSVLGSSRNAMAVVDTLFLTLMVLSSSSKDGTDFLLDSEQVACDMAVRAAGYETFTWSITVLEKMYPQ